MRKKRIVKPGRCYHLVSRVAHRAFFFDAEERNRFIDLLMRVEFFCGVRVLSYCCMSNHIHIFLYLEHQRELTEEEVFSRINKLYKGQRLKEALQEWEMRKKEEARICAEHGGGASASSFRELQNDYKRRMFDLSEFMKILKQNMTMSFNARRDHTGTIWEGRFYDKMSDVKVKSMSMQAAYIDCNPVEAGICRNPAEYEWCSWAAAKAGNDHARSMYRFIYNNPDASWEDIEKLHEKAISARVGEIDTAIEAGGIVDWLFSMFDSEIGKKSEQEQDDESKCKEDMPQKWDLQLEEGNSETAMTILRLLEGGDKSCAEIAQAIGISSKPWLSKAYLAPLVAQGYVGLTVPERVNSRHQKYHLLQKGQTLL
jgi:REP element-mobilizing transposase RayT/DNA-binding HxlR family transcriptional regulator